MSQCASSDPQIELFLAALKSGLKMKGDRFLLSGPLGAHLSKIDWLSSLKSLVKTPAKTFL